MMLVKVQLLHVITDRFARHVSLHVSFLAQKGSQRPS